MSSMCRFAGVGHVTHRHVYLSVYFEQARLLGSRIERSVLYDRSVSGFDRRSETDVAIQP